MLKKVRYKGPGGEIFPELNWQPEPGDVREIEIPDDATLEDHPTLEELGDGDEGDQIEKKEEETS